MAYPHGRPSKDFHPLQQWRGWTKVVVQEFQRGQSMKDLAQHFGVRIEQIEGIIRRTMD